MGARILASIPNAGQSKTLCETVLKECGAEGAAIYCPSYGEQYDGLLLAGGEDIDPRYYQEINWASQGIDLKRDECEMALLQAFLRAEKPVLGICRGCQVINVAFGGALIQDLGANGCLVHSRGQGEDRVHKTQAKPGLLAARLYGELFAVNSAHHQAVGRLGRGLCANQWSADGVVEGFEHESLPVYGVQWHPERMCFAKSRKDTVDGAVLLRWFVRQCENNRRRL